VQERASYIGRVRDLAKGSCEAWIEKNTPAWEAKYPGWSA
jgi:glycyl-tRNA synthetase alpha chain